MVNDSEIKRYLNDPVFNELFNNLIDKKIQKVYKALEIAVELPVIYRLQGQVEAYKRLKRLRDEFFVETD